MADNLLTSALNTVLLPVTPGAGSMLSQGVDLGAVLRQATHPVYNDLNRVVGSYATEQDLAAARIYTYPGEDVGPPSHWKVKNFWGVLTNAGELLISHNLRPSWVSPADAAAKLNASEGTVYGATGSATAQPPALFPNLQLPDFNILGNAGTAVSQGLPFKIAAYGAVGLIAVAVLIRAART